MLELKRGKNLGSSHHLRRVSPPGVRLKTASPNSGLNSLSGTFRRLSTPCKSAGEGEANFSNFKRDDLP